VTAEGAWVVRTPRLPLKAAGSGDLTSALFTAHLRATGSAARALALTASSVAGVLRTTLDAGEDELQVVLGQDAIASPAGEFEVEQVR
jgi:pyridoxine kinase